MLIRTTGIVLVCLCTSAAMRAQGTPDMQRIVDRLDRLEKQNSELVAEIQELRRELASTASTQPPAIAAENQPPPTGGTPDAGTPPPAERLDVQESRTDELAQTKIGTSQRMPVSLTGMVLFNSFHNSGFGGNGEFPVVAQLNKAPASTAATLRQTVIGLKYDGPILVGGGKVSGSVYFDFWGGTATPGNNLFRLRLATIDLAWKNTTITVGQDKPIVSPREPTSFAEVGIAPLTGAGNLWDWQPQVRIERRFVIGEKDGGGTGFRAQAGIYETAENYASGTPSAISNTLESHRPAYEGRLLFYHGSDKRRLEIAPGFHASVTHVVGRSVDSRLGTLDWLIKPASPIEFTGAMFTGFNDGGLGALRQGFTVLPSGNAIPVHATGGWAQFAIFATSRLSFHIFGGEEADRPSDLLTNNVRRNLVYAGNIMYKLAPNVLVAIETSQTRTDYIASGLRLNNHYDLALAYMF